MQHPTSDRETLSDPSHVRIVACQGGIQLITALAAMAARDEKCTDFLIVHDLYSPPSQHTYFYDAIRQMACALHDWANVSYLTPAEIARFTSATDRSAWPPILDIVRELVGSNACNELYLSCSWSFGAQLLRCCYRSADRVCYGDAIGINFTPGVVGASPPPLLSPQGVIQWIRGKVGPVKQRLSPTCFSPPGWYGSRFDRYSLLLPGLFDEPAPKCRINDAQSYLYSFSVLGTLLDGLSPGTGLEKLAAAVKRSPQVAVLLTTNLSESGKVCMSAELEGYIELLEVMTQNAKALVVVKPHPRDDVKKLDCLRAMILQRYESVIVLADPVTFYFPFEVLFMRYLARMHTPSSPVMVACVSSACLSLEYFFAVSCIVGFGDATVRRIFKPELVSGRIRHESDLRKAITRIRRERDLQVVASTLPR